MGDRPLSDAVRRHYFDTLAQRARTQPEPARHVLEGKLARAMAEHQARMEENETPPAERKDHPSPLSDLLRYIAQQTARDIAVDWTRTEEDHADLKSLRYFRDSWSKLSTDHSVAQALATGPSNAGPLNSHSLILQSLTLMRDIAPEYLNRFMTCANALLWLEEANIGSTTPKRNAARGEGGKKRKPGRD